LDFIFSISDIISYKLCSNQKINEYFWKVLMSFFEVEEKLQTDPPETDKLF